MRILATIASLAGQPVTWGEREPANIEDLSTETALAFVWRLPTDRAFPKVAPDGEGGLIFIWGDDRPKALVSVDGTTLSLVINPGTPASDHRPPMRFDGELIPSYILDVLPHRF
jgi:hypothetical protein